MNAIQAKTYIVNLNVIVEADNIRDAIDLAKDHAGFTPSEIDEHVKVVAVLMRDENGYAHPVQFGEEA